MLFVYKLLDNECFLIGENHIWLLTTFGQTKQPFSSFASIFFLLRCKFFLEFQCFSLFNFLTFAEWNTAICSAHEQFFWTMGRGFRSSRFFTIRTISADFVCILPSTFLTSGYATSIRVTSDGMRHKRFIHIYMLECSNDSHLWFFQPNIKKLHYHA